MHLGIDTPLTGSTGELIYRLVEIARHEPPGREGWSYDVLTYLALAAGGPHARIDTGRSTKPGSIGEWADGITAPIPPDEFADLLGSQLESIVTLGVAEEFLVRSLRDWVDHLLSVDIEAANEHRARARESMGADDDMTDNPMFNDMTPEEIMRSWTHREIWQERTSAHLSDDTIHSWGLQRAMKGLRRLGG